MRQCVLELETQKWVCRGCGRSFWQRFPGILPRMRATEPFRRSVCQKHFDGISRSRLAQRERVSSATIERWFLRYLGVLAGERISRCMDLAASYRALVRKHFPQAKIVADRFHVVRPVNQQLLACWKNIDPVGSKQRGLVSLMRRHAHHLSFEQQERRSAYLRQYPACRLSTTSSCVLEITPNRACPH